MGGWAPVAALFLFSSSLLSFHPSPPHPPLSLSGCVLPYCVRRGGGSRIFAQNGDSSSACDLQTRALLDLCSAAAKFTNAGAVCEGNVNFNVLLENLFCSWLFLLDLKVKMSCYDKIYWISLIFTSCEARSGGRKTIISDALRYHISAGAETNPQGNTIQL